MMLEQYSVCLCGEGGVLFARGQGYTSATEAAPALEYHAVNSGNELSHSLYAVGFVVGVFFFGALSILLALSHAASSAGSFRS